MQRFVFDGSDAEKNIQEGLRRFLQEFSGAAPTSAGILVPAKRSLEPPTLIRSTLGDDVCKVLAKDKPAKLFDVPLRLYTDQSITKPPHSQAILAIYVSARTLCLAEHLQVGLNLLVAVAWNANDIADWRDAMNPEISVGGVVPYQFKSDRIAVAAVESLCETINDMNRLATTLDRDDAIATFSTLRKEGIAFDPNEVRKIALRKRRHPDTADAMSAIARKVAEVKSVSRQAAHRFSPNILALWRERASRSGTD